MASVVETSIVTKAAIYARERRGLSQRFVPLKCPSRDAVMFSTASYSCFGEPSVECAESYRGAHVDVATDENVGVDHGESIFTNDAVGAILANTGKVFDRGEITE